MKKHPELTAAAGYSDPRSYVGWRMHPDTDHHCEYLKGVDVGVRRMEVFERDGGRCWDCKGYQSWDYGEMDHIFGGVGAQRCSCMENLRWSCGTCHRRRHVHTKFGDVYLKESHEPAQNEPR